MDVREEDGEGERPRERAPELEHGDDDRAEGGGPFEREEDDEAGDRRGVEEERRRAAQQQRHVVQQRRDAEEEEYLENLFDCLCATAMLRESKEELLRTEALELMVVMMKKREKTRVVCEVLD